MTNNRFSPGMLTAAVMTSLVAFAMTARADVQAAEGWSRATVPGVSTAAGYVVLTNKGDNPRKLLRISSPLAESIMLHQSSVDAKGMARMWPVAKLELAPGQSIRFEPNGRHMMFMGITKPFAVGAQVPLMLLFEDEEEITVMLTVRPLVP
jgi:periplasmic copper chaperone A